MKHNTTAKGSIVMVPYPAQGHITPMLNLASALGRRGFAPTMVVPEFIHRLISPRLDSPSVSFVSFPDGLGEAAFPDFFAIERAMEDNLRTHLEELLMGFDGGVACVVVDLLASPAIEVSDRCGIPVAGFWPAMLVMYRLIAAIPDLVELGIISNTGIPRREGPISLGLGGPTIVTEDLPWLIGSSSARTSRFKFWTTTLNRSCRLKFLLVNTFPDEPCHEHGGQSRAASSENRDFPLVFPVGPLCDTGSRKNLSLWKEDTDCLDWLDDQSDGSVVYVSFGSWVGPIGEGKLRTLAMALEESGRPFIWVLSPTWREGLPGRYIERVSERGRVVSWAPQAELLRHKAVGCHLTHCGWNSTLESIRGTKGLLCYPIAGDQFVNCAYIVKEWGVGVKLETLAQEDVEEGLRRVTEDAGMKERLVTMHECIFGEGGSKAEAALTALLDELKKEKTEPPPSGGYFHVTELLK